MAQQIQSGAPVQFVDPSGYARQTQSQFIATGYDAVTLNQADGTTPQAMFTAPADKYAFVTGFQITIDPTVTIASAGMVNITISDSVDGVMTSSRVYIPATPAAPTVPTIIRYCSCPGYFRPSSTKGSTVSTAVSTALTNASIRVAVIYGFSNVPIGNA